MTPYQKIYDAFLAKMLEDEWGDWSWEEVNTDWRAMLEGAIPWFKFPRVSLDRDDNGFIEDLSNEEIQILASYMKCEWLNRTILTWENVKPLYEERDFSQANLLDKFNNMLEKEEYKALKLERVYYRSIKGKPFNYGKLAGN
ncbi:hypothetical protein IJD44_00690 [bacterium]|nr:hypothetical protein [bacterium]